MSAICRLLDPDSPALVQSWSRNENPLPPAPRVDAQSPPVSVCPWPFVVVAGRGGSVAVSGGRGSPVTGHSRASNAWPIAVLC
jgi:hypothetical protein